MLRICLALLTAALFATRGVPVQAQTPDPAPPALRHHPGRGHRERLHVPLRFSSVDVHRDAAGRDCHRPDRLSAAAGGQHLYRRDQKDHPGADPLRHLQPPSLRPHRRRQAVQGRRRALHRAQECARPSGKIAPARHRHSRRDAREQEDDHARRHHARAHLCRPQPFGQFAGDAAAQGTADLHRRLHPARIDPFPQHAGQLADRMGGFAEKSSGARLGPHAHRSPLQGQARAPSRTCRTCSPTCRSFPPR